MYNSANDVIQLNDAESKKLVIKALGKILVPNSSKWLYPKKEHLRAESLWDINYSQNIEARDGRYRMEIYYGKVEPKFSQIAGTTNKCPYYTIIKPTDDDKNEAIISQKKQFDDFTWTYIGKKKKQALLVGIPIDMDKFSDNLINYAFIVFESVHQKILESETKDDDDWQITFFKFPLYFVLSQLPIPNG